MSTMWLGRVLVVDDDDLVGGMLVAHARSLGYEATTTSDPETFLMLAEELKPDFVIVDLVMGTMDGIGVLKTLARQRSQAKVIITSGAALHLMDAARTYAVESGLTYGGALPKPFRRSDVAAVLDRTVTEEPSKEDLAERFASRSDIGFSVSLRKALQDAEIVPHLQPKISCVDGHVTGAEALARWHHPVLGMVAPTVFVPFAERLGLVARLTDLIAGSAFTWLADSGVGPDFVLSINVSGAELSDQALGTRLAKACGSAGVEPSRIMLEVTETSTIQDTVRSLETLTRLGLEGFGLSVDDFGTGYSSVSQLARLPFSELKVDRSFVGEMDSSARAETVVRSMVALASGLGLTSVAEGVETAEQFRAVAGMGCTSAQGFHIARPMPVETFGEWVTAWEHDRRNVFMADQAAA